MCSETTHKPFRMRFYGSLTISLSPYLTISIVQYFASSVAPAPTNSHCLSGRRSIFHHLHFRSWIKPDKGIKASNGEGALKASKFSIAFVRSISTTLAFHRSLFLSVYTYVSRYDSIKLPGFIFPSHRQIYRHFWDMSGSAASSFRTICGGE